MQLFFDTHKYLIDNLEVAIRRKLMDQIDWSHRLIGLKGTRNIGKTTFLLHYAKEKYGTDKACLYVNLNNLYFTDNTIIEFADNFRKKGGKTLILDQVYKYPNWSKELRYCYDNFTDLQIIFSGSTVMRLREENPILKDVVHSYKLEGFSFREYLEIHTGFSFDSYSLEEIIKNHEEIAKSIVSKVRPLAYLDDYLQYGYYPFFLKNSHYEEDLMKSINFILEIDISFLRQIELKYLPRLRKLLYLIGGGAPYLPNISKLSNKIGISRATVMNYLYYLRQARLIKLMYEGNEDIQKKPAMIYLHNSNLINCLSMNKPDRMAYLKTFFNNQLGSLYDVTYSSKADFKINDKYEFMICSNGYCNENNKNNNIIISRDMIEIGTKNNIPLWLFGFLY